MRALPAVVCLITGACTFSPQLQRAAVKHNDIVANSNNELVLVNILRARDREPLHFTSVSKLYGDAQITAKAAANMAIKGGTPTTTRNADGDLTQTSTLAGTEVTTPSGELTLGAKSSLDVAVWDTQEFYQGITASIPAGTLAHYLHQGWPSDLMTNLFVSSVDFVARSDDPGGKYRKGQVVGSFTNNPNTISRAGQDFYAFVRCYRLTSIPKAGTDAQLVRLGDLKEIKLADLAILDGEKFDLTAPDKAPERWISRKGKSGDSLALRAINSQDGEGSCGGSSFLFAESASSVASGGFEGKPDEHSVIATGSFVKDGSSIPVEVQVVLRSVDGVIYYLGEYLRAAHPPLLVSDVGAIPIISVTRKRPDRAFTTTSYRGTRYFVPSTDEGRITQESGRSSQVFALIEQLLNLQKSAKDRPTTQTVRVVQ